MPLDGEKCTKLGTYKSTCCETELVIAAGAKFPRCKNHLDQATEWKLLPEIAQTTKKMSKGET